MGQARILIVEDELIIAEDIRTQLNLLGYRVVGVSITGEEAIEQASASQPDLVLMDVHLTGEMDGVEAARAIHSENDIPVIYLTSYSNDEIVRRAQVTDPYGYILKPFDLRELHIAIEIALHKHQMALKLKESEAKFRILAQTNPAGIAIFRPAGSDSPEELLYSNPAFDDLMGCAAHNQTGLAELLSLFGGSLAPAHHELLIELADGQKRWVEYTLAEMSYGAQRALLLTAFDITARKQAEARDLELALEKEKVRILADFIGNASHEFRTPLSILNLDLALIQRGLQLENGVSDHFKADTAKRLDRIKDQTRYVIELLESMLAMTRLDTEPISTLQLLDINGMLQDIRLRLFDEFNQKEQELILNLHTDLPMVQGSAYELHLALFHLVRNAIQYTPAKGRITLESYVDVTRNNRVAIEIRDTGMGIASADLPRVFDRFFRADTARHIRGMGLGLAMAKKIVAAHGGSIEVKSTEGMGSTFRVVLPAQPDWAAVRSEWRTRVNASLR